MDSPCLLVVGVSPGSDYSSDSDTDVCIKQKQWREFLDNLVKIRRLLKEHPEKLKELKDGLKKPSAPEPKPSPARPGSLSGHEGWVRLISEDNQCFVDDTLKEQS